MYYYACRLLDLTTRSKSGPGGAIAAVLGIRIQVEVLDLLRVFPGLSMLFLLYW